jgi:hypothetical protein
MREMRLKDRLTAFMKRHRLNGRKMAAVLQTPYGTFEKWMRTDDTQPPGCLVMLMDILEQSAEARRIANIEEARK